MIVDLGVAVRPLPEKAEKKPSKKRTDDLTGSNAYMNISNMTSNQRLDLFRSNW